MKIIVAICGASGTDYGVELLKALKEAKVETHLIVSKWAEVVAEKESEFEIGEVKKIADFFYEEEMDARISSSSFLVDAMVVMPASVKTVSEIANADSSNLISRCADNVLKMQKKLIIGIRETPLSAPCLKNLYELAGYGVIVMPLSPGFYHKPKNIKDLRAFIVGKTLDVLGIENKKFRRWKGN